VVLRGGRSMDCALFVFFGIVPTSHIESQVIRLPWTPRAGLVLLQGCCVPENGVDDRPRSFHRVFANEQHAISAHGISQKTLICVNFVGGGFLDYREMRGLGDKFFAGSLHSGTKAKRNFSWTEAEAEKIARFVPQNV